MPNSCNPRIPFLEYRFDRQQEEKSMRIAALVILMLTAAFAPHPAMAAYNLPWCAQYDDSNILSCAFTSMRQC